MLENTLSSVTKFTKENWPMIGAVTFVAGIVALEIKHPGSITVKEDIPTMKIIHVHVNE